MSKNQVQVQVQVPDSLTVIRKAKTEDELYFGIIQNLHQNCFYDFAHREHTEIQDRHIVSKLISLAYSKFWVFDYGLTKFSSDTEQILVSHFFLSGWIDRMRAHTLAKHITKQNINFTVTIHENNEDYNIVYNNGISYDWDDDDIIDVQYSLTQTQDHLTRYKFRQIVAVTNDPNDVADLVGFIKDIHLASRLASEYVEISIINNIVDSSTNDNVNFDFVIDCLKS